MTHRKLRRITLLYSEVTSMTDSTESNEKASTKLPGTVEKIIKPGDPSQQETAEIAIEGAEDPKDTTKKPAA